MKRITTIVATLIVLLGLLFVGGSSYLPATAQSDSHYFKETGHTAKGRFLAYWNQHGSLAQFGYPLTDEFTEVSDLNGKPYTVQYFERAVFEYHPENQPPYDVLLSQLGTYRLRDKYPNGGPTPAPHPGAQIDAFLNGILMFSTAEGYAVGDGGSIYHYTNASWQKDVQLTKNNLHGIYISPKGLGYTVGGKGTILAFNGQWGAVNSPTTADLYDVDQSDLGVYWFVGNGVIVENISGKWSVTPAPANATLASIDMVNADEGWAVGATHQPVAGIILHYINGQWQQYNGPSTTGLNRVRMSDATNGWIVGDDGTTLHYIGGQWVKVSSPATASLRDVSIISNNEAWAVGTDLLHYVNGQWSEVADPFAPNGTMNALSILSGSSPLEGWAVGATGDLSNPGAILHFRDGNWTTYSGK